MKSLAFAFFLISITIPIFTLAQINVDESLSLQQMIERLTGEGVRISNVSTNCAGFNDSEPPIAYFTDNTGTLNMREGLVLTNGAARNIEGPNDQPEVSRTLAGRAFGTGLEQFVPGDDPEIFDYCAVSFDITVYSDTLRFNYIFGSDEYPEYVDLEYYDVFAFFVEGPGLPPGGINAAIVPGTNQNVSVATVNDNDNNQFFRNNGNGTTPFINLFLEYDGFTRKFENAIPVIPCSTYTFRFAIADVQDDIIDSGVLIESGSIRTDYPQIEVNYEYPELGENLVEGCGGAEIIVTRSSFLDRAETLQLNLSGSAVENQDYTISSKTLDFLPNETSKSVSVQALIDSLPLEKDTIFVSIVTGCVGEEREISEAIPLVGQFKYDVDSIETCSDISIAINPDNQPQFSYSWFPDTLLSCTECSNPIFKGDTSFEYTLSVSHIPTGCIADDTTLFVKVTPRPNAAFSFENRDGFTAFDLFFINESELASSYLWSFGDGGTSTEENPMHAYPILLDQGQSVSYLIELIAASSLPNCFDTATAIIEMTNDITDTNNKFVFFIPNVVTVDNDDDKNDEFEIVGIIPGQWTMQILNRWGQLVVDTDGYNQDWGSGMQAGTYFYRLTNPTESRVFKGWVEVIKP